MIGAPTLNAAVTPTSVDKRKTTRPSRS
jgi:hypothetical protein